MTDFLRAVTGADGAGAREHSFRHGTVSLRVLSAWDLDPLLVGLLDSEEIPYWSVLWDSGEALAHHLLDQRSWAGCPVLEVGCGAGLLGLALAAAGAEVLQTDRFPGAAVLARENAGRNGIPRTGQAVADWRAWPLRGRWPVIVGADVTYERASHAPLLDVLARSLTPGGVVYLADPGRPMNRDFLALAQEGWEVTTTLMREGREPLYAYTVRRP